MNVRPQSADSSPARAHALLHPGAARLHAVREADEGAVPLEAAALHHAGDQRSMMIRAIANTSLHTSGQVHGERLADADIIGFLASMHAGDWHDLQAVLVDRGHRRLIQSIYLPHSFSEEQAAVLAQNVRNAGLACYIGRNNIKAEAGEIKILSSAIASAGPAALDNDASNLLGSLYPGTEPGHLELQLSHIPPSLRQPGTAAALVRVVAQRGHHIATVTVDQKAVGTWLSELPHLRRVNLCRANNHDEQFPDLSGLPQNCEINLLNPLHREFRCKLPDGGKLLHDENFLALKNPVRLGPIAVRGLEAECAAANLLLVDRLGDSTVCKSDSEIPGLKWNLLDFHNRDQPGHEWIYCFANDDIAQ